MPQHRKPDPPKTCAQCGATLHRKRFRGTLESMGCFLRRRFCDLTCSGLAQRKAEPTRRALLGRVRHLRKSHCERCGTSDSLSTHHINRNWRDNRPENLQTLCASCHTSLHHEHGDIVQAKPKRPCRICAQPSERVDLCGKHRQRMRKYGDPCLTKIVRGSLRVLVRQA